MDQIDDKIVSVADANGNGYLDFEKPLAELEAQIVELQSLQASKGIDYGPEIRQLRHNLNRLCEKVYKHLTPWETVQVSRHPRRPLLWDYIELMVKDFQELHGDRLFGDDKAMVTGFGRIGREKVMIVGQNKGRTTEEKIECNFGLAHPEGYRKALRKMKLAEKFGLPVVCLIDTPGAYPGIGAEERGVAEAIAVSMMEMSRLRVPIICAVIGEGGSGGALGIGLGDRVVMMAFAWYSVASPEACAGILWKNGADAPKAAQALKITSGDLLKLGAIDAIIREPLGGAHRNPHEAAHNLETYIIKAIRDLRRCKIENLLENRYQKFRNMGQFSIKKSPGKAKTVQSKQATVISRKVITSGSNTATRKKALK